MALSVRFSLLTEQATNHKRPGSQNVVISLHVSFHALSEVGLISALTTLESFDFVMNGLSVNCQTLCFLGLELANLALKNFPPFYSVLSMVESNVTFKVHLFESLVITFDARMFHLFMCLRILASPWFHIFAPLFSFVEASGVD